MKWKKKIIATIFAAIGAGVATYLDKPELAQLFAELGAALVVGLGLEDFGKAKEVLANAKKAA